jgi:tetratricopeptide (TPR) repeat protein
LDFIGCELNRTVSDWAEKMVDTNKKKDRQTLPEIFALLNQPSMRGELACRIDLLSQALTLVSRETQPELWAQLQDDLASSLAEVPGKNRGKNIEQAIRHYQLALEVRRSWLHPFEWAATQNNLATAYRDRIYGVRADNVEKALDLYQQALEVRTRELDPVRWAMTQANLADAYRKRILKDRAQNLEFAIEHVCLALEVFTRQEHMSAWAQAQNILGEIYRVRILGSRNENIEKAVLCFQQALEVYTSQAFPYERVCTLNNLGNAYLARTDGERARDIDQAIECYQQALAISAHQDDPEHQAMTHYNLGNAYRLRIRGSQSENIELAIYHFEQALEVRTRETFPEDWAQTQNNLGNAYLARVHDKAEKNIEEAITCYQQALEVQTRQSLPQEWAGIQNNLGNAYLARAKGVRVENLQEAVGHFEQALQVQTRETCPEEWAQTLNNLAGVELARGAESIEQAIQHLQAALEVRSRRNFPEAWAECQNNLAIAYRNRVEGERAENVSSAIQHYQQALEVYRRETFPDHCMKTARALGNLAFEEKNWELAVQAYEKSFGALDLLMQASFSREVKQIELGEVQYLAPQAAYANVKRGDLERAVEVLEQGRAQLLRETIERRRRDLERLPDLGFGGLYEEYVRATQQYDELRRIETSEAKRPANWRSRMELALEQVYAAAEAIRKQAGEKHAEYRFFMQAMPFLEIQKQAHDGPLVYLSATSAGGLALIVSEQGVRAIRLPGLNQQALRTQIWRPSDEEIETINAHLKQGFITSEDIRAVKGGYFSMYALWSLAPYLPGISGELFEAWKQTLEGTTRWLCKAAMRSLVGRLKKYGDSAILIPTGQLALLPLHAAWSDDPASPSGRRYALDELKFSYVPSAHALWQARLAAERPAENLLAVDNPDGTLRQAENEVQFALAGFKQAIHLPGRMALVSVVKEGMQKSHVLHFATHARAGWEEAEQARLKLADDGYLTLPELFELDLNQARLAVLSACETGVPGLQLIDEMIGLPAGMMQAGVPGVVGSLWSVSDMSTAMLMARFYYLWREEGIMPQESLRQAQVWLRDSSREQKKAYFRSLAKQAGSRAGAVRSFFTWLSYSEPETVDFSSPYFWAAFTYTGI